MKLIVLVFLGLAVCCHAEGEKIVNGTNVALGERPFQVIIEDHKDVGKEHVGSGSIINVHYVLTAASLLKKYTKKPHNLVAIAGAVDLNGPTHDQHKFAQIILHEGYTDDVSSAHNIALVKVKIPFKVNEHVTFAHLPPVNSVVPDNVLAVVSGWGSLHENGPVHPKLQMSHVYMVNHAECKKKYAGVGVNVQSTHVCAANHWNGLCNHDVGNPLTVKGQLVGVSVHTHGCAHPEYPGLYTSVAAHVDWIQAHSAV